MKYLSEGSNAALTSVADWKPIPHERFVELLHLYSTVCSADVSGEHGNEGMGGIWPHAYRHAVDTTATIWYMPKGGKAPDAVSSPVLMTLGGPSKTICFEHLAYGLEPIDRDERMRFPSHQKWKVRPGPSLRVAPAVDETPRGIGLPQFGGDDSFGARKMRDNLSI